MMVRQEINYQIPRRHKSCFIVFFSDFTAEIGLTFLLKNSSPSCSSFFYNDFYSVDMYKTENNPSGEENLQCITPVHESINYFLRLKKTFIDSKIIILTESHDPLILKLFASFKIFYLLSKKENPCFIHRIITEPENITSQYVSPDFIEKIGCSGFNKPLSQREWFVLNSLARKLTPAAISKIAGINVKTISAHKINAMKKLGLSSSQFLRLLMKLAEVKNISTIVIKEPPK